MRRSNSGIVCKHDKLDVPIEPRRGIAIHAGQAAQVLVFTFYPGGDRNRSKLIQRSASLKTAAT